MLSQTYDIYFSGKIIDGEDPATVKKQIGKLFNADEAQLNRLFSGSPAKIKSGVDEDTATKYRVAIRKAGALVDIKLSETKSQAPATSTNEQSDSEGLTLLPANTGSLEDCAPEITPQDLPNIDHLSMADAGTTLDESPDPEPLEIDTDDLTLGPANSGTLEDCKKEVEPYPIPDITHLDVEQGDS